jgi:putative peptide zinc metalloprotease protein
MDVAADPVLPRLRQELRIDRGAPLVTGAPSWTLTDPVRHLFYQLGKLEMRIFSLWSGGTLGSVRAGLAADGLDEQEREAAIGNVLQFSLANSLTVRPKGDPVAAFSAQRAQARKAWWKWLVDHYLFIRLPLVKPALILEKALPRIAFFWSPRVIAAFGALALLGLFLVARQWDNFLASFPYFFSMDGIIAYGIALFCVKVIHELGHAFTATRYGVRVPTMGVSLLVMMPVLYTDTTGAWRLTSRRKRLMIDIAGVTAEMMVASVATMAWVMLPDGGIRSAAFVLATSSWAMSLMINLNPLMRYDGYYIFSDALAVPNLQIRAFALGRWWLREKLFDLGEPRPEDMPRSKERILIGYALTTWIYRFFLFLGIAFVVYHMFFKLLGIILFVVEISVFLARPILRELGEWAKRKDRIMATTRGRWIGGIGLVLLLAFILPLDRHVSAPAVLSSVTAVPLVAGDPARIDRIFVRDGDRVAQDAAIAELSAPDLARDAGLRQINIKRLELQLGRAASDQADLANRAVLERELATERAALSGLSLREAKLILRAPSAGIVTDLTPDMHAGRWVGGSETIARIVSPGDFDVEAYLNEGDGQRVSQGALARFIPDDPTQGSRRAKLIERASSAALTLDQPMLASTNGGPIAVDKDGNMLKPHKPVYRARLIVERESGADATLIQTVPGRIRIEAQGQSVVGNLTRWLMQLLRGEASLS